MLTKTLLRTCFTDDGRPKLRFDTRADAKAWDRDLRSRYPENKPLEQYKCSHCGYFHNGAYPSDPDLRAKRREQHRHDG